jgi:hypothetical protein
MTPLKEAHRQLEYLGFTDGKEELFAALGRGTSGAYFVLIRFPRYFPLDHYPGSALGTGDARTYNVISHAPSV